MFDAGFRGKIKKASGHEISGNFCLIFWKVLLLRQRVFV
jgi:hypothetical protein